MTVLEQKITHVRELVAMHQIGRALDESIARAEALTEPFKPTRLEAVIRDIGAEIVKGLWPSIVAAKFDFYAAGNVRGLSRDADLVVNPRDSVLINLD